MQLPLSGGAKYDSGNHVIHLIPRISAAQLALYMVADDSARRTIIKNAKMAPKIVMGKYARVRAALSQSFEAPTGVSSRRLAEIAQGISNELPADPLKSNDNKLCVAAIKQLERALDDVDTAGVALKRPPSGWGFLSLSGVKISVSPDLVFTMENRGITKIGGIITTTAKKEDKSLGRKARDFSAGDFLSCLLYRVLDLHYGPRFPVLVSKCYAIDILRSTTYSAPSKFKALIKQMDAACQVIAGMWDSIQVPPPDEVAVPIIDDEY